MSSAGNAGSSVEQQLNHEAIQISMDVVHEAEEVMENIVECHNLLDNNVADDEEEDEEEILNEEDEDDDVVECIDAEQQEPDQNEVMSAMVDHVMDDSDGDAVRDIVDKLQQQQQHQQQQQQLQAQLQDVVQLAQHSFMPQPQSSEYANEVSSSIFYPLIFV